MEVGGLLPTLEGQSLLSGIPTFPACEPCRVNRIDSGDFHGYCFVFCLVQAWRERMLVHSPLLHC